jgi:hypothetical protein
LLADGCSIFANASLDRRCSRSSSQAWRWWPAGKSGLATRTAAPAFAGHRISFEAAIGVGLVRHFNSGNQQACYALMRNPDFLGGAA